MIIFAIASTAAVTVFGALSALSDDTLGTIIFALVVLCANTPAIVMRRLTTAAVSAIFSIGTVAVALALPACPTFAIIFALVIFCANYPTIIMRCLTTAAVIAILSIGTVAVAAAFLASPTSTEIFTLVMFSANGPAVVLFALTLACPIQTQFIGAILVCLGAIGLVLAFTAEAQDASIRLASSILAALASYFALLAADLKHLIAELVACTVAVAAATTKAHRFTIPVNADIG